MLKWLALLTFPLLLAAQTAPQPANHYVGSETCKTCHPDVTQNFYRNPHYKSIASGTESRSGKNARSARSGNVRGVPPAKRMARS